MDQTELNVSVAETLFCPIFLGYLLPNSIGGIFGTFLSLGHTSRILSITGKF